ncbi:MAG: DUF971 domain-containing protein [Hyphomicrobiaceae bacterium]|nr:DUF971 domain-containing protein [Hyphomicrobiaceae bacterium]
MHAQSTLPVVTVAEDGRCLVVRRGDGSAYRLEAGLLWRECRSAAGTVRRMQGRAQPPIDLRIVGVAPIGRYAVNLAFSDGHDRGIYPWGFLDDLAGKPTAEDFVRPLN